MRFRLTPLLVPVLLVATSVGAARGSQCADAVQGKIAWDYAGSKDWASKNVERLCAGAEDSAEPARCFDRVMHGGIDWGGGTRWQWVNALNLCKGTRDAEGTVGCFVRERDGGRTWQEAIGLCTSGAPSKAPLTATLVTEIAAAVAPFKSERDETGTASEQDDGRVVERSAAENVVHAACPDGRTLIAGGCRGVGGDALIASNPVGDTWVCQFQPRETPLEKTAMAICAERPAGYETVTSSAVANLAHAACPDGRTLIAGGCRGVGGDALIASNPVGDTWVCQFQPRETPLEKTAMAICAERPAGYETVTSSAVANLAHAACPGGRTLIAGGCRGIGGDALIASNPVGDTWVCQFTPRERPLEKTAMAICAD